MLGNLIGGFIVILIGTTLAPVVANSVQASLYNSSGALNANFSSAAGVVLGLTTLFYSLAIASSSIGIAAQGLRNSGLM